MHHDILLSSFPLAVEWLNYDIGEDKPGKNAVIPYTMSNHSDKKTHIDNILIFHYNLIHKKNQQCDLNKHFPQSSKTFLSLK